MALTTITYTCGHEETIQLYGNWKARDKKQAQLEAHECPKCHAKHATERDEAQGFEAITGTVKQIGWASDIRQSMLDKVMDEMARTSKNAKAAIEAGTATKEQALEVIQDTMLTVRDIINGLANETKASWYIDNRNISVTALADLFIIA